MWAALALTQDRHSAVGGGTALGETLNGAVVAGAAGAGIGPPRISSQKHVSFTGDAVLLLAAVHWQQRTLWAHVAAGVFVPDGGVAQSWRTDFRVTQDSSSLTGASRALVQVPGLALHVELSSRGSAYHHVHALGLTTARLILTGGAALVQSDHGVGTARHGTGDEDAHLSP